MSRRLLLTLLVLVVFLGVGGTSLVVGLGKIEQPIAFNHRLHVEDLGAECVDCHLYAVNGVRATIPNVEVCADCHAEAQTDSSEEALLVDYIANEEPIPWRKIYRLPGDVYFSHRRHTGIADIECVTCHGLMAEAELPVSRPVRRISMDRCMRCHEEREASNACLHCHR